MTATAMPVSGGRRQDDLRARNRSGRTAVTHELKVKRMDVPGNSVRPIPSTITLIRRPGGDPAHEQLFLDHIPVRRDRWSFDEPDSTLTWHGVFGGGYLKFTAGHLGAFGNIGGAEDFCSVSAGATARFHCDVALNTGATYLSEDGTIIDFEWDPSSSEWVDADWQRGRLDLTYTVTPGGGMSPPTFTFEFDDNLTQSVPWLPGEGTFGATLNPGARGGDFVWNLVLKSQVPPDPDLPRAQSGPDTVYPYWLHLVEDAAAQTGDGVMLIDGTAGHGTLVGMEAVRASSAVAGYYRVRGAAAPFRVFSGRLHIGDAVVPESRVQGSTLTWRGLSVEQQQHSGLPEAGSIQFTLDGSSNADTDEPIASRLDASEARAAVASASELHTELQLAMSLADDADASALTITGLMEMNPYVQDPKSGQWSDAVQSAVTSDLSTIMNSFIPADMWNLVLPGQSQPVLSGELATVANLPVQGVTDPTAFYKGAAAAVLTSGMANGSDPACAQLNGPRASQWLKTQIALSKVYYTHGQALFRYEWGQRFALTSQYLSDQIANGTTYAPAIDQQVQLTVADINDNIAVDAGTDPNLKANLIADVTSAGQYAKDNNLYWAFYYYTYNTSPAILANIGMAMSVSTGASDGTVLSRMLQQNTSVLTALDPSGYFAKLYTQTLNTFLAVNILPSMFSFADDAKSYDLIKQYLQLLVNNNLSSENAQIAAAAAQLQQILAGQDGDELLHDSIDALRDLAASIQDTLALPYIANGFVTWFSTTYPKLSSAANMFGGVLLAGLSGMAMFNIVTDCKRWDDLTDEQKAQLVIETAQFGVQVLAAIVVRGVRIYAILNVDGLTLAQRSAAISKAVAGFDSEVVDQGLLRISNTFARYLGDTAGTTGRLGVMNGVGLSAVMVGDADEVTFMAAVIGKNLTEFVATSVGAVFVLAGIGVSIWSIVEGDAGLALAGDILNIVSGALTLFAVVGGFCVTAGVIAAESILVPLIAAAGPLAILLAFAGIGIALYLLFKKPPDPVQQFVDNYAKPVGLALPAKATSIDYVTQYANPDLQQLLMCGAQLRAGTQALSVAGSGTITAAAPTAMPDTVWQWVTDGLGLSRVSTIVEPTGRTSPAAVLLSLMSDGSVSFQPPMGSQPVVKGQPTVVTQTWLFTATGNATLTSDGTYMTTLPVQAQPVHPDSSGNYIPQNASGYLATSGNSVTVTVSGPTTFTVVMSGLAPNYMTMRNITFIAGTTPDQSQVFAPVFGIAPSTPTTFASSGTLPTFLTFAPANGSYQPNGGAASVAETDQVTVSATNALGTGSAPFTIQVEAATSAMHAAVEQTVSSL